MTRGLRDPHACRMPLLGCNSGVHTWNGCLASLNILNQQNTTVLQDGQLQGVLPGHTRHPPVCTPYQVPAFILSAPFDDGMLARYLMIKNRYIAVRVPTHRQLHRAQQSGVRLAPKQTQGDRTMCTAVKHVSHKEHQPVFQDYPTDKHDLVGPTLHH